MNPWQALAAREQPVVRQAIWGGADLADKMRALNPQYEAHDAVIRTRLHLPRAPVPAGGRVFEEAKAAAAYRVALDQVPEKLREYVVQWDPLYAGERRFYAEVTAPIPTGISTQGMDIAHQFEVDLASMRRRWQELTGDTPIPLGPVENPPPPPEPGLLERGGELLKWGAIAGAVFLGFQALRK